MLDSSRRTKAADGREAAMAWDFETDPEFQAKPDWTTVMGIAGGPTEVHK
jgi:hypothetical protein